MAIPPLRGRPWSAANLLPLLLLLVVQAGRLVDAERNDDNVPLRRLQGSKPKQYHQAIVTFEETQPCAAWMFPPEWEAILDESFAPLGLSGLHWTHAYKDRDDDEGNRDLQVNSGCPDWCLYLTQYCDCSCVTNCNGEDDSGDDQGSEDEGDSRRERQLLRRQQDADRELQEEELDQLHDKHTGPSRTKAQAAQFIVDEYTAHYFLVVNLAHYDVHVECLNQNRMYVYLI